MNNNFKINYGIIVVNIIWSVVVFKRVGSIREGLLRVGFIKVGFIRVETEISNGNGLVHKAKENVFIN